CARLEAEQASELGPNIEVMPCVVPACEGVWYWEPDMKIAPAKDGDLPTDRMCDAHRREHDLPPRPAPTARVSPATASDEPPEGAEELLDHAPQRAPFSGRRIRSRISASGSSSSTTRSSAPRSPVAGSARGSPRPGPPPRRQP